ncbi:MarR family transcriptional regulator [Streptomyces sp. SID13031]|uniref:MarR family winged helix-turn-helix transcriptional regulator n=1 Tax=Streptomyces sp. SID13031 TaxID=2706046 RepID=UPI0013CBF567|nr:MarR family transcriptional regulator [Streptomyces sp. SID13031]NEA34537.1 MarR family transcriptional regulator [Streptomyces sp. SID13031]
MTTDRVGELIAAWQQELPSVLHPTTELTKRVMLLAGDLNEVTRRVLRELGLTTAEFDVLGSLRRSGAPCRMKPTDLSRSLLLSSGGTSNVVNQLVNRGLVVREPDPDDGRGTQIRLTAKGIEVAEQAVLATSAAHDEMWAGLPADALQAATEALRPLLTENRPAARARRTEIRS